MPARILLMGAGSGAGNNLIASLRSALPDLVVVGVNLDPFILRKSAATRNYLLSLAGDDIADIARLVDRESIDLVIPATDADVSQLSDNREALAGHLFLPSTAVIDLCADKYDLAAFLAARDVPVPVSLAVISTDSLDGLFEKLTPAPCVWCRARSGSGSLGAAPVTTSAQARAWIEHWEALRGIDAASFMVAEYLPGRDFFCQSLWDAGRLVLVKTCERVSYFGGENSPSGVSSLYSLAKTVVDGRVVDVASRALRALDPALTGTFGVDLKENAAGVPCVTEINAGRLAMGMTTIGSIGRHNLPGCYVRLALGETFTFDEPYDCPPDYYIVRDLDAPAGVFHADDIAAHFELLDA